MFPIATVKILGQFSKSLIAVGKHRFRHKENLSRIQRIGKLFFLQSQEDSCLIVLIHLRFALEASAVNESQAVAAAKIFICIRPGQNHQWIILMTGSSPAASDLE